MPRGKKDKMDEPAVEELKDAAEETTVAAAVAVTVATTTTLQEGAEVTIEATEVAAAAETTEIKEEVAAGAKRKAEGEPEDAPDDEEAKRNKTIDAALIAEALAGDAADASANAELVPAAKEGQAFFTDQDVLSGRGGGTNVHPGNRRFRDLINVHRRAYLKARKNDKPSISRNIVRQIRASGGKFLKKDEKSALWFEVGDDAAREKTSQALRQRAPEMRKLLFDTEREEARVAAQEHLRQQRMFMGMPGGEGEAAAAAASPNMPPMPPQGMGFPPFPFPPPPPGFKMPPMAGPNPEQYRQFFEGFMQHGGGPPGFPGFPSMPFPMFPPGAPGAPPADEEETKVKEEDDTTPAPLNEAVV
ncbi:hypothetical protein MPSEU_000300500 [Mayamaea pseudoterrestris]|nr:hypothetical protein MPSEU_000300500 [Mayamaea pseudoterrestris]